MKEGNPTVEEMQDGRRIEKYQILQEEQDQFIIGGVHSMFLELEYAPGSYGIGLVEQLAERVMFDDDDLPDKLIGARLVFLMIDGRLEAKTLIRPQTFMVQPKLEGGKE